MNIERNEFLKTLKRVMPGVETGNVILEGADTFIFDNGYIHSYNDNISVSVPFEIKNKDDELMSGALKAKDFYDLISRLSGKSFKLIPKVKEWKIKSGNAEAELVLLESSIIDHVKTLLPKNIKWNKLPEKFIDGISLCRFNANKSVLAGIYVNKNSIISTDEIRINSFNLDAEPGIVDSFWITDTAALELSKLNKPKGYFISKSWVHFLTEDKDIFSCKRLDDSKYPIAKIQKVVESHAKEKTDVSGVLPKNINEAINRAAALSQNIESFDTIKLTFRQDGIEVFSQRPSGKYTENVEWEKPLKKEIKPISIFVDYSMIENGIKSSKSFYLKETKQKDRGVTRIIFVNDNGIQLINTFDGE